MPGRPCGGIFHQSLAEARDLGTAAMLPTRTTIRSSRERSGVKYNEGAQLDPSQMGGGGRGNGGKIAIGGGAGLIVLLLALLFGLNPGDILGGAPQAGSSPPARPSPSPSAGGVTSCCPWS